MRFIYFILIGLVVFNASIVLLADTFNYASTTSLDENAVNATDSMIATYGEPGNLWSGILNNLFSLEVIFTLLFIFGSSNLLGRWTGGQYSTTLIAGIGIFIGVISALWIATFKTINNLVGNYGSLMNGIVTIVTIAIGIIIVFSIVEMLVGQQGAGN